MYIMYVESGLIVKGQVHTIVCYLTLLWKYVTSCAMPKLLRCSV